MENINLIDNNNNRFFKAFIRVVKSLNNNNMFGIVEQIREPLIIAKDKNEVKQILLEKYPQFFQNNKIYEKETKDKAQFFYVVIFELYNHEIEQINKGEWICAYCGQKHENTYIDKPLNDNNKFGYDVLFCKSDDHYCLNEYKKQFFTTSDILDDTNYITSKSPNYIYKITEKLTNKCYIGKTRNEPFFRWWNHLKHSYTPFVTYLKNTKLSDWTFEVLEILSPEIKDADVFRIESEYIIKYNSIKNGYNSIISNKIVKDINDDDNLRLNFEN